MDYDANTLIIGLGGLGGRVLRDVRKRMFEEGLMGAKATQPLPVGFLYVDASDELMYPNDPQWWTPDGQDAQISLSEFLHINYNGGERIAKNLNYFPQLKEFAEHCQDLAFCQPNCGAMQNRRCGRILFASNVTAFRNAVTAKAGDLKSMTHCYGLHRVFIVASLSGGTGSGTIVDVIAQVSKLYPEARIYVLSALPDKPLMVYETGKLMANAYAALRELNALNIGEFQPFDITAPTPGGTIDADRQQPFLLIPFALSDFRDTTSLTDSLYHLLTADDNEEQVLHRLHSLEVWMRTECDATPSESYHVARTRALASLSLERIFYPRERILHRIAYTLLGQSLQQMLFNNYQMERGFVKEIKETDLSDFLNEKRLTCWLLDSKSLTLQRPILDIDRLGHIVDFEEEWDNVITCYNDSVKDEKNPLAALTDIMQERYEKYFRRVGVQAYYEEKKRNPREYACGIVNQIEGELFTLWKQGQLGLMQILEIAEALSELLKNKKEEAQKEQERWQERAETYKSAMESKVIEYDRMNILVRFLNKKNRLNDFCDVLRDEYVAKTYGEAYGFSHSLLQNILCQLKAFVSNLHELGRRLQDMIAYAGRVAFELSMPGCKQPSVVDLSNEDTIMKFEQAVIADQDFMHLLSTNLCTYLTERLPDNDRSFWVLSRYLSGNNVAMQMANSLIPHLDAKYLKTEFISKTAAFEEQDILNPLFLTTLDVLMSELQHSSDLLHFVSTCLDNLPVSLQIDEAELMRAVPNDPFPSSLLCAPSIFISLPKPTTEREEAFLADLRDAFCQVIPNAKSNAIFYETDSTDEIAIMCIRLNFPIRAISILPMLKDRYDKWMTQDRQRALSVLHIEDSCANLPSLEVEADH